MVTQTATRKDTAFGLIEVVIASLLLVVLAIPIISLTSESRVDSCKAINYQRALEIAHETIEWVQATPLRGR